MKIATKKKVWECVTIIFLLEALKQGPDGLIDLERLAVWWNFPERRGKEVLKGKRAQSHPVCPPHVGSIVLFLFL